MSDEARINDKRERDIRLLAELGLQVPLALTDIDLNSDPRRGRSLLVLSPPSLPAGSTPVGFALRVPAGQAQLHINTRGELSGVEFRCRVSTRNDALALFDAYISPVLDQLSYKNDVPIYVRAISWIDELNGTTGGPFFTPYAQVEGGLLSGQVEPELSAFYALYREAITNPSVFYQFLCFSKILEGAFRWKLAELFKDAMRRGIEFTRETPRVPKLDPLGASAEARQFEGRAISEAFERFLEPEFRDAVAHFKTDNENPLEVTKYLANTRFSGALELARVAARGAIEMLEAYLRQIRK